MQHLLELSEILKKAKDSGLNKNNTPIIAKCDELLSTFGIGSFVDNNKVIFCISFVYYFIRN